MTALDEWRSGKILWQPTPEGIAKAEVTKFTAWVREHRGQDLPDYDALWQWSVDDLEGFWSALWEYCGLESPTPYTRVVDRETMPGAKWFEGAQVNLAAKALERDDDEIAIWAIREDGREVTVTWHELREQGPAAATGLRKLGIQRGDRVVGIVPNNLEATVAFYATISIGAIWTSCAPEYGVRSLVDRFAQVEPRLLIATDGYVFNGKQFNTAETLAVLADELPTLEHIVVIPYVDGATEPEVATMTWAELTSEPAPLEIEMLPFEHPIWILYSSGTTGLPKPIVHSHGGMLLNKMCVYKLQMDLTRDDVLFWYTSTAWVMWNITVATLIAGTPIVLFDGSPAYPDLDALWALAERLKITYFGHGAGWYQLCMKAGIEPGRDHDLSALRCLGSTGSPLPPEAYRWLYEHVGPIHISSGSGGTDVAGPLVTGSSVLPVYEGEIQCKPLGVKVEAWDPDGNSLVNEIGELVVTKPIPGMPIYLWNDPDGTRLHDSYFDMYPGIWRHGDWVLFTEHGGAIIYGRSDATLNRGGVRMGTSEFYRVVEDLPEIADSLVVDTNEAGAGGEILLFVQVAPGLEFDDALRDKLRARIRADLSPRHMPDRIVAVPSIPYTLTGKKCEVPVKRVLLGTPLEKAVSLGTLRDPSSFDAFVALARTDAA